MAEQEKSIVDTGTGIPELDSIMNAYSRASRGVHDTEWWGEEEWEPIAEAFTKAREAWNKRTSEPNTRSTDERVRELRQRIADELAFILDNYNDRALPAVSWLKEFDSWLDELFPACKPSEEEVNG